MTKSRVPAIKAKASIVGRYTSDNLSRDKGELALNSDYLGAPEVTIVHRIDRPLIDEPRVSEGDLVIADRRVKPDDGSLVIVMIRGETVVRRYSSSEGLKLLCGCGKLGETIEVTQDAQIVILATVVSVIPMILES